MEPEDRLLLGTDLVKDAELIEAAYNDEQGLTVDFNRNVLRVLNDGLGADFDPEAFEHMAFFDAERSWIEMRLRANGPQTVSIPGADMVLELEDGEEIRTEISAKFTSGGIEEELAGAGLRLEQFLTDADELFGLSLSSPQPPGASPQERFPPATLRTED
jgi:L-histidine N-alpha-methyltransferase